MRVRWLGDALLEASESARYYRSKSPDLGAAFLAEVRGRIAYALRFPKAGTQTATAAGFDVRRLLFERFEYALVFVQLDSEVVIVAVHHQHRKQFSVPEPDRDGRCAGGDEAVARPPPKEARRASQVRPHASRRARNAALPGGDVVTVPGLLVFRWVGGGSCANKTGSTIAMTSRGSTLLA